MNSVTMVSALSRKQVDHAEGAPELAEALEDQAGVADARDGAEPQNHLLVHVEHGDQQHQGPQKRGAVVLPRLRVGAEGTRVVVAHHDDQAGSEDREQCGEARAPADAGTVIPVPNSAEGTVDVTDMGLVQDRSPVERLAQLRGKDDAVVDVLLEVLAHDSPPGPGRGTEASDEPNELPRLGRDRLRPACVQVNCVSIFSPSGFPPRRLSAKQRDD